MSCSPAGYVPESLARGFLLIHFDLMQSWDSSLDWIRDGCLIMISRGDDITEGEI